ncbi:DegT/DnrJ/EryC1/StrS family aminotransferase [Brevibacterium casei]|uniref:DegT/DnrJ/EryC1/StrS family aminotransferase n=1 Tax=Brevibacterium casei TaxID=33889 RepID=UPI00223B1181|nr:DegT/DnrJ/EryC1/StrS aminotransferase family protein [Brevibacterium casei]MCT1549639.1 DegT/DnrJ/EryC1/StrS aminotransferase family protein [Brevibacterium casei]MCT1559176.1 DegT/DnrJ/EryC1/StrS aminotransferase family protein [Brevibacterium casei]MCT2207604.1 DegT/DnrJ/EryC1/StrS aminotransferase family protein [Brevibacterium casei]
MTVHSTALQVSHERYVLPFGRAVYGAEERDALLAAFDAGDLATGRKVAEFETAFAAQFGFRHAIAVSSGSVANMLAIATLIAMGRLAPGDRVLVSGATFITAVAPIVQLGLHPVFVDVATGRANTDLELALRAAKDCGARGALLPHTLGQPLDNRGLKELADRGLVLVEDCCESLGARDDLGLVGTVGSVATFSFYAGHHVTTGEGGMLGTNDDAVAEALRSMRAFGRDPAYSAGRFRYPVGDRDIAPEERYVHKALGYNAKLTDLQASIGIEQLRREPTFRAHRRSLAASIATVLEEAGWQILGEPAASGAVPFGIPFLIPEQYSAAHIVETLARYGVDARGFLGASLPDQPCFDRVPITVYEPFVNARHLAHRGLIVGCPPGGEDGEALAALRRAIKELA